MQTELLTKLIGKKVSGIVDRPSGTYHPKHKNIFYPINYGYIENLIGGDGKEQDAYILGTNKPLKTFKGIIIAVYHRLNDIEDKLIVSLDGKNYSDKEILNMINFQEKYFKGEIIR